jgi:lipopolysaccharide transport system ATP-binding protein
MSDAIISVEGLGKKYRLSHQGERQRYVALRDVIAEKAKRLFRRNSLSASNGERAGGEVSKPSQPTSDLRPPTSGIEDFWALRDVSFEVKRGEVVGIIGRNGAGKSTLLKILSRITEPTEGRVTLRGRVASLLEVGTGFHPELTGRENIFLNGAILGMSRAEIRQKFDEIVAFAEVEKFLDTPVKRYSSGMYVRLAFAVAAHLEPEILIVDEVLAVGDAEFQKKCLGKMQDVAKGGRTVLFVSHNMAAIGSLCNRVVVLGGGRLSFDGEVEAGINSYHKRDKLSSNYFQRNKVPANKSIWISEIEICSSEGNRVDMADNGKPLSIQIFYQSRGLVTETIIPSLTVTNGNGVKLFQHHSRLNKNVFNTLPTTGKFTFRFHKLPLPASTYRLSVYLCSHAIVLDGVEDAIEFSVFDGGFYTSGETTPASHGVTLVEGEWSLETCSL